MDPRLKTIEEAIEEAVAVHRQIGDDVKQAVCAAADAIVASHRAGGRLLAFGNGGSAADAQHLAAELVGRFLVEREPISALALTTNPSTMTCLINDYPPDDVFARQVRAHARAGDVSVGISTSGNSPNVVNGLAEARRIGAVTIGLTGLSGGAMREHCDLWLPAPSNFTPRIQEVHDFLIHAVCQLIDEAMTD